MGWQIKLADEAVDVDSFSPDMCDRIAREGNSEGDDPGAYWWDIYESPGVNTSRLYRVVCQCAEMLGESPPPKPSNRTEIESLLAMVDKTTDIADGSFVDGFPQMPDAPEPGSSSGVPGDSTGLPTSSDDNESVTS